MRSKFLKLWIGAMVGAALIPEARASNLEDLVDMGSEVSEPNPAPVLVPVLEPLVANGSFPRVVNPFPKIGPIHRGYTQDGKNGHYYFDLMGQGKVLKKPLLSCMSAEDPGCYGVACLKGKSSLVPEITQEETVTFSMKADDFYVGRTFFEGLLPGEEFEVQAGYVIGVEPDAPMENSDGYDWSQIESFKIKTPPQKPRKISSILYGSCARIGKIGPLTLWRNDVEKIFEAMVKNIADNEIFGSLTDAVLTLGDFPYMDPLLEAFAAKNAKEMHDCVKLLYSIGSVREVMKNPFYQMRDDHEWWNDSTSEVPPGYEARAVAAQHIYNLFQRPQGKNTVTSYQIIEGNFEAFMCDTRSERTSKRFMRKDQMEALQKWLSDPVRQNRVKPVFFSAPVLMLQTDDTFYGYKKDLVTFLNWIQANNIKGSRLA